LKIPAEIASVPTGTGTKLQIPAGPEFRYTSKPQPACVAFLTLSLERVTRLNRWDHWMARNRKNANI